MGGLGPNRCVEPSMNPFWPKHSKQTTPATKTRYDNFCSSINLLSLAWYILCSIYLAVVPITTQKLIQIQDPASSSVSVLPARHAKTQQSEAAILTACRVLKFTPKRCPRVSAVPSPSPSSSVAPSPTSNTSEASLRIPSP